MKQQTKNNIPLIGLDLFLLKLIVAEFDLVSDSNAKSFIRRANRTSTYSPPREILGIEDWIVQIPAPSG